MEVVKLLIVSFSVSVTGNLHHVIESPKITNWGSWGELESCPVGTFVSGMQLKVEKAAGWKDDTGLNGLRLFCTRLGQSVDIYEDTPVVISSSVGAYGEWQSIFRCGESGLNPKTSAIVGFQLKVESPKGARDDTSTNNFRAFCEDLADEVTSSADRTLVLEGDGTHWGEWTDQQLCRKGYALCGLMTQIDANRGNGYDDTALNNIRAECCKIRFHDEDFHEARESPHFDGIMFPDPVESAKELERSIAEKQHVQNSHDDSGTTSGNRKPISLPEVLLLDHTTEQAHAGYEEEEGMFTKIGPISETKQESLDQLDEQLNHLARINFGKPQVSTHFKIAIDDNTQSGEEDENLHTIDEIAAKPIVPPEVVHYIEADRKDEDEDPETIQINVIAGSIATNLTNNSQASFTPKNVTVDDHETDNQLLVAAGGSPKFNTYWSGFIMVFIATNIFI